MTNFNWQIVQMTRKTFDGFVTAVHFVVTIEDAEHRASAFNVVEYEQENGKNFKPFNLLTEAEVLDWVWSSVDKAAIEAGLQDQIQVAKNPVLQTGLPWDVLG
jgi:hypothetical protein